MDLQVKGKSYLIMGASRGLGQAVAEALSSEGAVVTVTSRHAETAVKVAKRFLGVGLPLDTSDIDSVSGFLEAWNARPLDGIFVNTGGPRTGDLEDLTADDWTAAYQQLLLGPTMLVRGLKTSLNPGASVVFNASISVRHPIPALLLSNVFRPAIAALSRSLALSWAQQNIRVNVMAPGRIATERIRELEKAQAERDHLSLSEVRQAHLASIPLGRVGEPEEFGRLAAFLLSPQASYITGETLVVGGGL